MRRTGRAAAQIVLVTSAQAEVPGPVSRVRGARAEGGGERHNQQTQVVPPALLTPRQTAAWALFEHRKAQKDVLSPSPQEIWKGSILIFLFSQQVVRES